MALTRDRDAAGAERTTGPDVAAPDDEAGDARPVLTLGEATALVGALAVGMVATWSLALAQLGRHDGWAAVGLGVASTGALGAVMWFGDRRPVVRVDRTELALVAVTGLAAAFFFLPGFPYASADKDPGIYVVHAFAIAREGDVSIDDPVLERDLDTYVVAGARYSGLWLDADDPDVVTPQFYHLYPATLATADDLVGSRGVFHFSPVLAILSVCMLVIASRSAANTATALVFGGLLVTSMMQVWQAKYPSTEIMAQFLLAASLLGGVVAVRRRWAGAAFASGVLLGVGFLARPDGFLYILLAAALVGFVIAIDRFDRRSVALGAGVAVTFPYAAWNAYELRAGYSATNSVPSLATVVGACAAVCLAGVVARAALHGLDRWRARRADTADDPPAPLDPLALLGRWRVPLGIVVSLVVAALFVALWHREELLGTDYVYSHFQDQVIPSRDEVNIKWLSWFVSMRGLALAWFGLVALLLTRTRASLYLLVLPGAALLPVYLWDARISMRLMWWVRRFVPAALPALVLLMAIAIGWLLLHRVRALRVVGAAVALMMLVEYASQSLPLRDHHEMAGSWEAAAATAELAGDQQGVFLYTSSRSTLDPMRNTPGPVWFIFDQVTARLSPDYDMDVIDSYVDAFPGQPVFLVTHDDLPPELPAERFTRAGTVTQQLTMWEESTTERPDEVLVRREDLVFWRVDPEAVPAG